MSTETGELAHLLAERPQRLDDAAAIGVAAPVAVMPPSETVLDLSRWNRRRGANLLDQWNAEGLMDGAAEPTDSERLTVADAHAALFEPAPRLAQRPVDQGRSAWWKQLMETPEYKALHRQTCLEDELASLAAKRIVDQWFAFVAEHPEQRSNPDGEPGNQPGGEHEPIEDTMARIRSTQQALSQAAQDVQAAHDLSAGLGRGDGGQIDRAALAKYFQRIQDDEMLRRILAMAGRMRTLARSLQRNKTHASRGEITGIELGGDVARLIPSELALVAGVAPELELLALKRLAERRSFCYRHVRNEPVKAGPIVVCVDESSSMSGEPIIAAKALAMTMAWLAQHQHRWCALVSFSGDRTPRCIVMPPGRTDQAALIEWLCEMFNGGTVPDVPLDVVPHELWPQFVAAGMPQGRTDMVIVTDGQMSCRDEMRDKYLAWRQAEQVRAYGIRIGMGSHHTDVLDDVCDRVWNVDELGLDNAAVESVLSI